MLTPEGQQAPSSPFGSGAPAQLAPPVHCWTPPPPRHAMVRQQPPPVHARHHPGPAAASSVAAALQPPSSARTPRPCQRRCRRRRRCCRWVVAGQAPAAPPRHARRQSPGPPAETAEWQMARRARRVLGGTDTLARPVAACVSATCSTSTPLPAASAPPPSFHPTHLQLEALPSVQNLLDCASAQGAHCSRQAAPHRQTCLQQ